MKKLDQKFWKKYFEVYDILNIVIPYKELLENLVSILEIKNGQKILDLGSGTGNLSIKMEEFGAKVTSLDYSKEGLSIHKNKGGTNLINHDLTQKLPFEDNYFDKIVSNNVLYTIKEEFRQDVIKEVLRILKPNGMFVLSNIKSDFKPRTIYLSHIKKSILYNGYIKTIFNIIKLLIPTIKMFYYNSLIEKENSDGSYSFVSNNYQKKLLLENGFINISKNIISYSGQAITNKAYKK